MDDSVRNKTDNKLFAAFIYSFKVEYFFLDNESSAATADMQVGYILHCNDATCNTAWAARAWPRPLHKWQVNINR